VAVVDLDWFRCHFRGNDPPVLHTGRVAVCEDHVSRWFCVDVDPHIRVAADDAGVYISYSDGGFSHHLFVSVFAWNHGEQGCVRDVHRKPIPTQPYTRLVRLYSV
jgi:hypothetical protein